MSQFAQDLLLSGLTLLALGIPVFWSVRAYRLRQRAGGILLRWRPPTLRLMLFLWWLVGTVIAVLLFNHGARPLLRTLFLCAFVAGFFNITAGAIIIGEKGIFVARQLILWESIVSFSFWKRGKIDYMRISWHMPGDREAGTVAFPIPPNRRKIIMTIFRNFIPSVEMENQEGPHES